MIARIQAHLALPPSGRQAVVPVAVIFFSRPNIQTTFHIHSRKTASMWTFRQNGKTSGRDTIRSVAYEVIGSGPITYIDIASKQEKNEPPDNRKVTRFDNIHHSRVDVDGDLEGDSADLNSWPTFLYVTSIADNRYRISKKQRLPQTQDEWNAAAAGKSFGGAAKKPGKSTKVYTGPRGGQYAIKNGKKVYKKAR
jgi:hypothetical protein